MTHLQTVKNQQTNLCILLLAAFLWQISLPIAFYAQNNRELIREKQNSCITLTRQLTREEPLPQSIYRIKTRTGEPAVAIINLKVKN